MTRKNRIISIEDAVSQIVDGMTIGIGEFSYQNPPMAVVREIAKQGKSDLTIVSGPTSGLATDTLIRDGSAHKLVTAGVAFEGIAGIAPAFRRASEAGWLEIWECDECIWQTGLEAAARGVPYQLWQGGIGSDLPLLNPDLEMVRIRQDGLEEEIITSSSNQYQDGWDFFIKVPAIRLDMTFIHAAYADEYGNVAYPPERYLGRVFNERLLAEATTGPVFASVEKLVSSDVIMARPELTVIRDAFVIESPGGARPGGCNGVYEPDLDAYREYIDQFKS